MIWLGVSYSGVWWSCCRSGQSSHGGNRKKASQIVTTEWPQIHARHTQAFLLTAALIVLSVAAIAAQVSPQDQLAAAEAKWAMNKPRAYEFTYKQICFCSPLPPGTPGSEPIIFHVENGIGALTGAWADRPQARQGLDQYSTVDKQFAFIRAELAKRPYRPKLSTMMIWVIRAVSGLT